jgi:hypothetical protein
MSSTDVLQEGQFDSWSMVIEQPDIKETSNLVLKIEEALVERILLA